MLLIKIEAHSKSDYKVLLNLASKFCDTAYMVVRPDLGSSEELEKFLDSIQENLITYDDQSSSWPSTTLLESSATVNYYRVNSELIEHLGEVSNSFFGWMQPKLPEDLGFLKDNKEWLINTAHEKDLEIVVEDHEREEVLKELQKKGIKFTSWVIPIQS